MDVDRPFGGFERGDESAVVRFLRRGERHRDVRVGDVLRGEGGLGMRKRFGMIGHREVDDLAHADRGEPRGVMRLQSARGGDLIGKALPRADVRRIGQHLPRHPGESRGLMQVSTAFAA